MTAPRTQQHSVYDAESGVPSGQIFDSVANMQDWVDGLRDTWWWERWYWRIPRIEVHLSGIGDQFPNLRSSAMARWDDIHNCGVITVRSRKTISERTLVHEVAHIVSDALHNSVGHDPVFARDYANLTYLIMGGPAWLALQEGYTREKVEY